MPDNCMLMDGICVGDRIVAAGNLRPCHGDLVVCRIPGLKLVTVRRYAGTSNPSFFDLYEGGTTNPLFASEYENLICGVVVGVSRTYLPGRLPRPWEPVPEIKKWPWKNIDPAPQKTAERGADPRPGGTVAGTAPGTEKPEK